MARHIVSKEDTVPPRVEFLNRSATDKIFSILYALSYIGFLACGFFLVSKAKPAFVRDADGRRVVSDIYREDLETCCTKLQGVSVYYSYGSCHYLDDDYYNRRLQTTNTTLDGDEGMFDVFLEAPEIIIGILLTAFGAAIIWILLLRFFAKPVVIASEATKIGIAIAMGVKQSDTGAKIVFFLVAAGLAGYAFWARKQILFAAKMITHSTIAMKENPSILAGSLIVKCLFAANAAFFVLFASETMNVVTINEEFCSFENPEYVFRIMTYLCLSYLWTIFLLDKVRLSIIATIVGSWHFHPEHIPTFMQALTNVGPSMGTLSIAALISTIAEKLNRMINEKNWSHLLCLCINPFHLILCLFSSCINGVVKMFTKFSVILHVFTGQPFVASAKHAFKILSRHFKGGFVTEVTSKSVLTLGSYAFSIGLAMATWAWVDDRFNCGTLSGTGSSEAYLILWLIGMLFSVYFPVLGIYLMILINQLLRRLARNAMESGMASDNHMWIPPMAAIFVGSIAMMLFMFLSKIFLDTIDTLFLCFAIDKDNNLDMSNQEFTELVKNMPNYTEAEVVSEGGDEEKGDELNVTPLPPPTAPVVAVPVMTY